MVELRRRRTVGIQIERHVDVRHTSRRRRNSFEIESTEQMVVSRQRSFAFVDLYSYGMLECRRDALQ